MSDKEDSTPSLRDSEKLSVQHSVGVAIPELPQRSEEGTKIPASVAGQYAGDVFPDDPTGRKSLNHAKIDKGEVTVRAIHSLPQPGHAKRVTGRPGKKSGNWLIDFPISVVVHVAVVSDVWVMMFENSARERFDLRTSDKVERQVPPSVLWCSDP